MRRKIPPDLDWRITSGIYLALIYIERLGFNSPQKQKIWFEVYVPPTMRQLSYNEYTDRTLSVGR